MFAPEPNDKLEACCWYSKSTCCTNIFSSTLLQALRFTLDGLSDYLQVSSKCVREIENLSCLLCDPKNSNYIYDTSTHICNSICDTAYSACADYTQQIFETLFDGANITSGFDFCTVLMEDSRFPVQLIDPVDGPCYAGVSESVVTSTGECYTPEDMDDGDGSWNDDSDEYDDYDDYDGDGDGDGAPDSPAWPTSSIVLLIVAILVGILLIMVIVLVVFFVWKQRKKLMGPRFTIDENFEPLQMDSFGE
eukprot:CAMPEP_0174260356 /NCGR_PEP_ID=MMETSP0439-20130205/9659_1 /TAXON_ID=0 /ORGANISM="Stereomyxa ramosa, Strain Chinc5" /LENGTH=248 /DNA_ID=CAMNT_0015344579 /DNA_START=172 /DNA_END=918 /DNA_ORIENTATION=-